MKRIIGLLMVFILSCHAQENPILFQDPLDDTVVDGWTIPPDHFVDHPAYGKLYKLVCHGDRLDRPTPQVGDESWTTYRIEIEVLVEDKQGFVGLGYHVQNQDDHSCDVHFATWRETTTMQAMGMWGNKKGSFKLYLPSQREIPVTHGQWMRLRVDVGTDIANVYHEDVCVYTVYHLPYTCGGFRFWASYNGSAYFRNLVITQLDTGDIEPQLDDPWQHVLKLNVIRDWQITELKPATDARSGLDEALNLADETFKDVKTDDRGVVNLSAIYPNYSQHSVLAQTTIPSETDKTIRAFVTYTDRFTLYCNDQLVFQGPDRNWYNDNRQQYGNSRLIPDQFEVELSLHKGNNTLMVRSEVMEEFGWGFWMRTE